MIAKFVSAFVMALSPIAAHAVDRERCDIERQYSCAFDKCALVEAPAWSIIHWDTSTYDMCDPSGCQTLRFAAWPNGIFTSLSFDHHELMVKLNNTSRTVMETSGFLEMTVSAFGRCHADESQR